MKFRLITVLAFWICSLPCLALDLELTQGISSALPIAVNPFSGEKGTELSMVVQKDLGFSGQFRLIEGGSRSVAELRGLGADNVVIGKVSSLGGDRYQIDYQLLDAVQNGSVMLSKNYTASAPQLRALAHHISDEIYQKITGERGIFSTRVAYVLVKRQGRLAQYGLEVADIDGYNPRSLLVSSEPIMSPAWSPDGKKIAYVSFEKKRSEIYVVTVATGQRQLITNFKGINGAPTWSPSGREMVVVLSKSGNPKLYQVDLSSGNLTQLTDGTSIDTEPRYAPDGQSIIFTSGRGGSPQVYRLSLTNGQISRLTFEGNYNARATLTPNQRQLVMLHREEGKFNIAALDMQNSQLSPLTSALMDESPSIAPNGRLILYATRSGEHGVLGMVSIDGRIHLKLPSGEGDVQEPAWSPYLN